MARDIERPAIGFIGVAGPGAAMALRLLAAGRRVLVHASARESAAPLLERGAEWRDAPGGVARDAGVLVLALPSALELAAAFADEESIPTIAPAGATLLIATPCSPSLARQLHDAIAAAGRTALDVQPAGEPLAAPRPGLLVGGGAGVFERLRPLLELAAGPAVLVGPAGAAQHARIGRRIADAAAVLGLCEAVAYARAAGLDPGLGLAQPGAFDAPDVTAEHVERISQRDHQGSPTVEELLGDLASALEQAESLDLDLPGVELLRMLYGELSEMGLGNRGPGALAALWEDDDPDEPPPDLVHLTRG